MSHLIFDAETPPELIPVHAEGVMGYLGGPRAARAWTLEEWQRFDTIRQFPVYVADVTADPFMQAREALDLAVSLGWSDTMKGQETRLIVLDLETSADRAWYARAASRIEAEGFIAVAYGSLSTVLANAADDVLAADWNGNPAVPLGQVIHGGQFSANVPCQGTLVDWNNVDDWFFNRGGVGPRHRA